MEGATNQSKNRKVILVVVLFILGILFFKGMFTPEQKPVAEVLDTENWNLPEANPVVRITNKKEREAAIEKVYATIDDAFWDRLGIGKSYIDVYQNPIGDGVIVWIGAIASPNAGYVYLISNNEVYAVSGDTTVLSPQVQSTSSISFSDVKDIGIFRVNDKATLYTLCLKDAESFRADGLVEKRIKEKVDDCKARFGR
ncbi:MAG: hypothetical protein V4606_02105 [Patescibacteria group bacterium]